MNLNVRIAFYWLLIVIGYIFHSLFNLTGLVFGIDIKSPEATGSVPIGMHIFRIVVELFPFLWAAILLRTTNSSIKLINFVLAILFGLLNLVHLAEGVVKDFSDYAQVVLMLFILIVNIFLILDAKNWRKQADKTLL